MIHIKTYKLFESLEDIEQEVKDILVDMTDEGITINVELDNNGFLRGVDILRISIDEFLPQSHRDIYVRKVIQYLPDKYVNQFEHLNSYLKSKGFEYDAVTFGMTFDEFMEYVRCGNQVVHIQLNYNKGK